MSLEQQQILESDYVMGTFARKPVELVEGKGMEVADSTGKTYLDFIAGIGVNSLGHCHPAVSEAIAEQAKKLIHVGNYYYIENRGEVAHMLSDLLNEEAGSLTAAANDSDPDEGKSNAYTKVSWQTFFANSGAEANECAIKLARLWAKKGGKSDGIIVTMDRSFHGRTLAALAATAQPAKQEVFKPLPGGFIHTPLNDIAALAHLFKEQGNSICAVMLECVQGESGVHPCDPAFIKAAEQLAHEHGALLICDEIQTGIFRTGTHPFAFQHYGVDPDIVTIAKGVASGFPVGMCSAKQSVAAAFGPGDHGTTFGGGPLAIAASKATLTVFAETDYASQVERVGKYLRAGLGELPHVIEVRGKGLMCACDLDDTLSAPAVVDEAIKQGLLINATGPNTLRFLPPLICVEADVDELLEHMRVILAA